MKKLFTFLLICLFSATVFGQLTVTVPTITATPGSTVVIPVKLIGASSTGIPIGSANIQITYDESVLTYVSLQNFYSVTPQSQWFYSGHDGIVAANWLEPNLLTITVPDSTTLFEIQFTYLGGNSPLNFIIYEFTDAAYELIPTTPVNGAVNQLPVEHNVTFNVDMSQQAVSPDGIHVAGSFNSWNSSQTILTNNGNDVYSATVTLTSGTQQTYKFINGNTISECEIVPQECGVPDGSGSFVRSIDIPSIDTTLSVVCFSQCTPCIPPAYTISGTLTYPTTANTPLAGVVLTLKNVGGTDIATATTDISGNYYFANIPDGNYTITSFANKLWGGVSASDVLLYKKHIATITPLTGIYLESGDVNGIGGLTATDVLLIKKRIATIISSFPTGDWLFNPTPVSVNGNNVQMNFNGIIYGDANASYNPL